MTKVIIGLGNDLRGDDGIGLVLARQLQYCQQANVILHAGEPLDLINLWEGYEEVILLDAVRSHRAAGEVIKLDLKAGSLSDEVLGLSTHAMGLAAVIELARVLNKLPQKLTFYGFEGDDYALGAGISASLKVKLSSYVTIINAEVASPC